MPLNLAEHATSAAARSVALLLLLLVLVPSVVMPTAAAVATSSSTGEDDLHELVRTETVLIDTLRSYIDTLEEKVDVIKRKTQEIKAIHDVATNDTEKYLNNPINALTLLKRFTSDWSALRAYAANSEKTQAIVKDFVNTTKALKFPSEEDYDQAMDNLLHIQDIYKLEPQHLAVGEVNGIKMGSEMSWSDCLEIGRASDKNGDYAFAKFWMETALGKLPAAARQVNGTSEGREYREARYKMLQVLMKAEFALGNTEAALNIVNEMLQLRPQQQNLLKSKAVIEKAMQKLNQTPNQIMKGENKQGKKKEKKTAGELLLEELCRDATTNINSNFTPSNNYISATKRCSLITGNLPQFLLQPLKVEFLNHDPYIVIYHDVLSVQRIDKLKELLADDEGELQFTSLGQRQLKRITQQSLQHITGHASNLFTEWQVQRSSFEHNAEFEPAYVRQRIYAKVLTNLQTAKLGGAIVFPQLELAVHVPPSSLLYWLTLNESHEQDYRSVQYVCPVIIGTQISAVSTVRSLYA